MSRSLNRVVAAEGERRGTGGLREAEGSVPKAAGSRLAGAWFSCPQSVA